MADGWPVIDPDCRAGKCGSCVGGPCEHECHQQPADAPAAGPGPCGARYAYSGPRGRIVECVRDAGHADELQDAIFDIIRQAIAGDRARALADWVTDRILGPAIAELERERDEQRQRADQAEAERADAERRARRLSAALDEMSAALDPSGGDHG